MLCFLALAQTSPSIYTPFKSQTHHLSFLMSANTLLYRCISIFKRLILFSIFSVLVSPMLSGYSRNLTVIRSELQETAFISASIEAFPVPSTEDFTWSKCDENGTWSSIKTDGSYLVHVENLQTDLIIKHVKQTDFWEIQTRCNQRHWKSPGCNISAFSKWQVFSVQQ